ncbi:hypothetical protein [Eubacterium barkeri]|uniref:Uncharacterized protein n=1 Tax=Eubacterium barkeri TaxID=1528 RepID=A0A1H3AN29_EUBBA|nr:hypothetical protein [Eubacterium barkeri]SDX31033.1 hypothetical protein SAMN04488579_101110 [Eubacterium barkeri]
MSKSPHTPEFRAMVSQEYLDGLSLYEYLATKERYQCKSPLEVRIEALTSDKPTEYPIAKNKRIEKYKEKWCA